MKENSKIKPVFVLMLNWDPISSASNGIEVLNEYSSYIKRNLGDKYDVMVIPVNQQPSTVNIFYPSGTNVEEYNNLMKELAKSVSFKNVRVNLGEDAQGN